MATAYARIPASALKDKNFNATSRVMMAITVRLDRNANAHPSLKVLGRDTDLQPQNVARAIRKLVASGQVIRKRVKSASRGWENNHYTVPGLQKKHPPSDPIVIQLDPSITGNENGTSEQPNPAPYAVPTPPSIKCDYLTNLVSSFHSGKDSVGRVEEGLVSVPTHARPGWGSPDGGAA